MQTSSIGRGEFPASGAALVSARVFAQRSPQRVVVVMCDGFGLEYLEQSDMPVLFKWRQAGLFRRVQATMLGYELTATAEWIKALVLPSGGKRSR